MFSKKNNKTNEKKIIILCRLNYFGWEIWYFSSYKISTALTLNDYFLIYGIVLLQTIQEKKKEFHGANKKKKEIILKHSRLKTFLTI